MFLLHTQKQLIIRQLLQEKGEKIAAATGADAVSPTFA